MDELKLNYNKCSSNPQQGRKNKTGTKNRENKEKTRNKEQS